jgi:hypothetical protein
MGILDQMADIETEMARTQSVLDLSPLSRTTFRNGVHV